MLDWLDTGIGLVSAASVIAGIGYWRRAQWPRGVGVAALALLWVLLLAGGWGEKWLALALVAALGPTLASLLGDDSATVFAAAIAGGGVAALRYATTSPLLFLLWLEESIVASYAAIALGGGERAKKAALVFFVASSTALILLAIGLFAPSSQVSGLLLLLGAALELSIAPLHLWGVDVVAYAPLAPLLAGFTAPKVPVIYVAVETLSRLGALALPAIAAYLVAASSILVGGLVGSSRPIEPRKSLAYGSVMHLALPLFLVAYPSTQLLAYYMACYVLGEAGLIAMIYSRETGEETSQSRVLPGLLLAGLVGAPPAASFVAKLGVLIASFHEPWVGLLALASLLAATPPATLYYTRAVLETLPYYRRGARLVLAFSSLMLILLIVAAPLRW